MKTPFKTEDNNTSLDADFLRRQYFTLNNKPALKTTEKKNEMLTPFLLSIPVIIMLIILIYSL